ncbi:WD40 repeat-like protein [Violaceomyces palustris]|uniref:WD40 repeat-like protein n=1 Tax=Violaceomyces palustris TaxID=1673888 RepID=A0ACD0P7N1_9BASI|nr:WD40 repeat-like protein [Violaceomyces palustris]
MSLSSARTEAEVFRSREVHLPNFPSFKPPRELRGGHRMSIRGVGWNSDGRRLASCGADKLVRIWTPERSVDHRASTELRGHTESVEQLAWDPIQPDILATAGGDRTVRLWDIRVAKAIHTVNTPGSNINIAFHPKGGYVAVGDKVDNVSIIDTSKGQIVQTLKDGNVDKEEINEICWSPDGSLFLLTTGAGTVHIHDAMQEAGGVYREVMKSENDAAPPANSKWERLHTIVAHTANVFCIEFDPLSRFVATASSDSMVGLWDTQEWMSVRMSGALNFPARSLSFSHDGEFLAAGGEDNWIDISSTATGNTVHKLSIPGMINTLSWHPSKTMLAYAGDEKDVKDQGIIRVFGL